MDDSVDKTRQDEETSASDLSEELGGSTMIDVPVFDSEEHPATQVMIPARKEERTGDSTEEASFEPPEPDVEEEEATQVMSPIHVPDSTGSPVPPGASISPEPSVLAEPSEPEAVDEAEALNTLSYGDSDGAASSKQDASLSPRFKKRESKQKERSASPPKNTEDGASLDKDRVGEYELMRVLGRGGMGTVYKAYHSGLRRVVALKVIHKRRSNTEKRFEREIRFQSRLNHVNICPVFDSGVTEGGERYLAMDFVEGKSLGALLGEEVPSLKLLAAWTADVAKGLHAAHQEGVIHRDLKPDNILIHASGRPIVVDFGIARSLEGGDATLTAVGKSVGTPAYMSPEQIRGQREKYGAATDVYGLGVVLYQGIAGRVPFESKTDLETMRQVVREEPPPLTDREGRNIDKNLEAVVLRCLEKQPEDRYPSAQALALDLECFLVDAPVTARTETGLERMARRVRRYPRNATMILVGMGAFLLWSLEALLGMAGISALVHEADLSRARVSYLAVITVGATSFGAGAAILVHRFWPRGRVAETGYGWKRERTKAQDPS